MSTPDTPERRLTLAAATEAAGLITGRRYWVVFMFGVIGLLLLVITPLQAQLVGVPLTVFSALFTYIGYFLRGRVDWSEALFFQGLSTVTDWLLRPIVLFLYLSGRTVKRTK